jgi:protein-disulfide isomerase
VAVHAPIRDDFDARYAATLELVKADVALGNQLNVGSTPTFFINGVKVEGQWAPQYFDQAIAYELRNAPAQ